MARRAAAELPGLARAKAQVTPVEPLGAGQAGEPAGDGQHRRFGRQDRGQPITGAAPENDT